MEITDNEILLLKYIEELGKDIRVEKQSLIFFTDFNMDDINTMILSLKNKNIIKFTRVAGWVIR